MTPESPLRELLLLRHAKSDRSDPNWIDFERPLAERGRNDAHTVGKWIAEQRLTPDYIITSPAKRTLQTIKRARSHFDANNETNCVHDARIYEATMTQLLAVLAEIPNTYQRVIMVGHNPGLEDLLTYLTGETEQTLEELKRFPTAALAHFIMPAQWHSLSKGSAKLIHLWHVKNLPSQA